MALINKITPRRRWTFVRDDPRWPDYVRVFRPDGHYVMRVHFDKAGMYLRMYEERLSKHGPNNANEFMQGFIMGMTHALMYSQAYPKMTALRNPETGVTTITVVDLDGTIYTEAVKDNEIPTPQSHEIDRHGRE